MMNMCLLTEQQQAYARAFILVLVYQQRKAMD